MTTLIDGVPAWFVPGSGSTSAFLSFGVGVQDETYSSAGVTHLIEHLVMSGLPRGFLEQNASVDIDQTVFWAQGKPEAVGDFLTRVCEVLSSLPMDRIATEGGVLQSEEASGGVPASAPMWAHRFGLHGPGTSLVEHDHDLPAEVVHRHASTYFTRANASLGVIGTPPESLRLPLPEGPAPTRIDLPRRTQNGPTWTETPVPAVGLMMSHRGGEDSAQLMLAVLEHRLTELLRHDLGLCYDVSRESIVLPSGGEEALFLIDTRADVETEVAERVWAEVRAIAEYGPRPEDVRFVMDSLAHHQDLPEFAEAELHRRLWVTGRGLRWRAESDILASYTSLTQADLVASMAEMLRTATVLVPETASPFAGRHDITSTMWCDGDSAIEGTTYRVPRIARVLSKTARQMTLTIGDAGVSMVDPDGDRHTIRWDQIVEVKPDPEDPDALVVFGRNACCATLDPALFGKRAIADFTARLSAYQSP